MTTPATTTTTTKQRRNWSWPSAIVGATAAAVTAALITAKPRDPAFELISIDLTAFKLNFPSLDAELILTVHVTNPNIAAIHYDSTTMSIYYDGALLGSAQMEAGSQPARSCRLLRLPARLSGLELVAHHATRFMADVANREMVIDAAVDVDGAAKVLWWDHKFRVHVESRVSVDPVFLDVVDQENSSEMDLFNNNPWSMTEFPTNESPQPTDTTLQYRNLIFTTESKRFINTHYNQA
ncbi:NDR1/HIN1-like protein 13 [Bienertia sinuspersici]